MVATDHCAFTTEQKRQGASDFRKIPNGTGGLEDRMPLLWTAGVNTGRLTKEEFVAVTSANIARILNVFPRKGRIAHRLGRRSSWYGIPREAKTISAKSQISRIDYNVFEGFTVVPARPPSRCRAAGSPSRKANSAPKKATGDMSSGRRSRPFTSRIRPGNRRPRRKRCHAPM